MEAMKSVNGIMALRHEDIRTGGIPDITTSGYGFTCWWEFKHGTPDFDSKGLQELTCCRLAHHSFCRYVVYLEEADGSNKHILIVHPRNIGRLEPEEVFTGFQHEMVTEYVRKTHKELRDLFSVSRREFPRDLS